MSGSVNKVIIVGNLGDDVKMHHFDQNNCIGRFPVATNESYTKRDTNERITQTEWHNIVTRNKLAELCEKYLSKGDSVYVEGKLRTRKWDDNGTMKYTTEIHANTVQFLNSPSSNNNSSTQEKDSNSSPNQSYDNGMNEENEADDLPF